MPQARGRKPRASRQLAPGVRKERAPTGGRGWSQQRSSLSLARWVAYEGTNFSGEQYVLEKGVYRSCEDWGASNCQIGSVQPVLQVRAPPCPLHLPRVTSGETPAGSNAPSRPHRAREGAALPPLVALGLRL